MGFLRNIIDAVIVLTIVKMMTDGTNRLVNLPIVGGLFLSLKSSYDTNKCATILIIYLLVHSMPLPLL